MINHYKKSLLITLDFPPNFGGVAAYYHNICRNLPPGNIVVMAPDQPGCKQFDQSQRFPIIRHRALTAIAKPAVSYPTKILNSLRWFKLSKDIAAIVQNHKIDIVHVGQILPLGTVAMMLKKTHQTPYWVYAHGLDITLPQNYKRKKILLKKIINHADRLIANSYFTKDELLKLGAKDPQVNVIYPCLGSEARNVNQEEIATIIKKHELQNKKILLSVGRLVKRKGYDMVIKSMRKIVSKVPDATYVIVGDGPDRKRLEMITALEHMGEYVIFVGAVSQFELAAYYSTCNTLIMPSRRLSNGDVEGFGMVYLEANSYGKPVIGGISGGVPEAIAHGESGLLVSPTDTQSISEAAIKLLTDESYAHRLGFQGMNRVMSYFDWENQVEKIKDLLLQHA